MAKLIGTNPNQVPTNADLGSMAYKDGENLQAGPLTITDGNVGVGAVSPIARFETVQTGQTSTAVFKNTNASWANDVAFLYSPSGTAVSNLSISNRSNGSVWVGSGFGPIHFQLDENENNSRSTKVTVRSDGYLTLNGNDIGGTQVTIADDAVASITPPRTGGFMMITSDGTTDYPNVNRTGMIYYDVGASLDLQKLDVFGSYAYGSSDLNVTTGNLTGTTGTDGNVTVSAASSGVIKVENRTGGNRTFSVTFL